MVELGDGTLRGYYLGKEEILRTPEEIKRFEQTVIDSGFYNYRCSESEMVELKGSKEKLDKLFLKLMKERLVNWVNHAEQVLPKSCMVYITGGNDDSQEVMDALPETEYVRNADNRVLKIDPIHEMVGIGWGNPTPWKCPRDVSEEDLGERIEKLVSSVSDVKNCVFNLHSPPIDCGLDTVQKLDTGDPPKPIVDKGQPVMIGAGSRSVRQVIEKYQPLVDLCGHVHESRGVVKIGKTLIVNPGSEYTEGILRGVIVNLGDKKILSWQLTSG
jgi:Icc-related predicted phosphoesterase